MSLKGARFKGRVKLKGRPENQARAEIMLMKAQEKYEDRKRRRRLFTILNFIIIVAFALAIYSVYIGEFLSGIILLIIGAIPLAYFILRKILKRSNRSIQSKNIKGFKKNTLN